MANSYENTIMPEKPEENIKPDAIPVDDKGQPLPDPTESLSNYIAPKGVEDLKKAYSEVEVDETVRETMEPPQRTSFLRKHKPGKRGYDYYGTPAGSIPNDSNGLKPSPLTELFSEAEAVEPDFDLEKIKEHVLQQEPEPGSEYMVVETPKLESSGTKSGKAEDDLLKRREVVKDPNAPKFLDMYKESTNTKVIYQSDPSVQAMAEAFKTDENAGEVFAEHSKVTKTKKKISKREEKKAVKKAIKLEKKKAKERRKAEKAARKAEKKAKRKGLPVESGNAVTSPDEIIGIQTEKAKKAEEEKLRAENSLKAEEKAEEKETVTAEAEAVEEKEQIQEQPEIAENQKNEAEEQAKLAAQEAIKRLEEEKEALRKQAEEAENAQKEKDEAIRLLNEEKAAAQKAAEEAKSAKEEAEKLKAELEKMKAAASQALAQKQEAEDAARLAREAKEQADEKVREHEEIEKKKQQELAEKRAARQKREETQKDETEKIRRERDEAIAKAKAEKDAAIAKAKAEREAAVAKAKAEREAAVAKSKAAPNKNSSGDVYMNSPTMEVIKRRIAEMEAQLSDKNTDGRK